MGTPFQTITGLRMNLKDTEAFYITVQTGLALQKRLHVLSMDETCSSSFSSRSGMGRTSIA